MSTPLSSRVPERVRAATAVVVAGALLAVPTVASARVAETDPNPTSPWTTPSDVLAQSLHRLQAAAETEVTPAPEPAPAPAPAAEVFATVDGDVDLVEPAPQLSQIGFHEGSSASLPLAPVGQPTINDSWVETPDPSEGPGYVIMSSRGRGVGPMTAADLALPQGEDVAAIVTGTVVAVNRYSLYGRTPDVFIEIAPEGRPDLRVQMFHIQDIQVAEGDAVVAGETVVAGSARRLPFPSQVDRFLPGRGPHVHTQVVRA